MILYISRCLCESSSTIKCLPFSHAAVRLGHSVRLGERKEEKEERWPEGSGKWYLTQRDCRMLRSTAELFYPPLYSTTLLILSSHLPLLSRSVALAPSHRFVKEGDFVSDARFSRLLHPVSTLSALRPFASEQKYEDEKEGRAPSFYEYMSGPHSSPILFFSRSRAPIAHHPVDSFHLHRFLFQDVDDDDEIDDVEDRVFHEPLLQLVYTKAVERDKERRKISPRNCISQKRFEVNRYCAW